MECKCFSFKPDYLKLKEYKYWTLYLAESQLVIGWTHLVLKRHIEFYEDLTNEELVESRNAIKDIKKALAKTFKPDWFNVMQLGNMTKHLHLQLVPRYSKEVEYEGEIFIDKNYGNIVDSSWKPRDEEFLTKMANYLKENME